MGSLPILFLTRFIHRKSRGSRPVKGYKECHTLVVW
jgi:hypothetical protein